MRHAMGEDGNCERCGDPYPWSIGCRSLVGLARGKRRRSIATDFARWRAREEWTRAALGSTPITWTDIAEIFTSQGG